MKSVQIHESEWWQITLPYEWIKTSQKNDEVVRFESQDGEKAISITTLQMDGTRFHSAQEIVEYYKQINLGSLVKMPEHSWETITEQLFHTKNSTIWFSDNYSLDKCYRISFKTMATDLILVNVFFHDYYCPEHVVSLQYFSPIIESCNLRVPPA